MKKLLGLMLLCAISVCVVSSCSKEDDVDSKENNVTSNGNDFAYSISSLYGTWEGTDVKMDGQWIDITSEYYEDYQFSITFYNDGTYYGEGYFGTGNGTYKASGKVIYTYVGGQPYYNYRIISLVDNIAELEMFSEGSNDKLSIKVKKVTIR